MTLEYQQQSGISEAPRFTQQSVVTPDGYELPFRYYSPVGEPKAAIIALHGFNDYSNAFDGMCRFLMEQSIHCYAYDQRGFGATAMRGQWPGPGILQEDLRTWVSMLRERHAGLPIFVAGESMGGAVAMSAYSSNAEDQDKDYDSSADPDGIVLLAPAVWGRDTQPWYQRVLLWFAVRLAPEWKPTGKGLGVVASDNNEALRAMGRDPLIIKGTRIDAIYGLTNLMDSALASSEFVEPETIIFYGGNDQVIPKKPTCLMLNRITEANKSVRFKFYEEGYHMLTRDLDAETLFSDINRWISQRVSGDQFGVGIDLAIEPNLYCIEDT